MKKLLSAALGLLLLLTVFPMQAQAASVSLGECTITVEYGSVTYFDDEASTLYETLMAMGAEGTITVSGQSFDLDKNGSIDLLTENHAWKDGDGNEGCSTEFSKAESKSIYGEIALTVSDAIKNDRKAQGKKYYEKITVIFEDLCSDGGKHDWAEGVKKATFGKGGYTYARCTKCKKEEVGFPLLAVSASVKKASYVYNGKAKKPAVTVSTYDGPLDKSYYKVKYSNNVNAGTASVKITLLGDYMTGTKTFTFKIKKAANTLTVKAKKPAVKYAALKAKDQTVARKAALTVSKAKGTVTYAKVSGSKKITVSKKTGKITVKKGLKKGTYKVKIKVKAAGNKNYKAAEKTVTVKIIVK